MAGIGVTRVTDCPVCLGTFKDPRFLPCGHTFCLGCIAEHGRSKGSDPDCPNCRTKFQISSSGFEGLPKNYSLNSVLNETNRVEPVDLRKAKVTKGSCKKHSGEELVLYCVQCNMVICPDCMEEDHQKHDYHKINSFAKDARMQLEGYIKGIKPILSQVTSQKALLQEKSKKFCDLLGVTELAINEEYEKNKRILDDHRRLLLEELSIAKQKVTKDLKMKSDEIETEQLSLASFNTRMEEMLQGTDEATTFDIVCQYKDFKDSFDKLKQIQPQAMGQVSVAGIEFIPGDFKDLIRRRENVIGRLQKESDSRSNIEKNWVLRKDLTPSSKQVDLSLSQKVPIDQHVWYYLRRKHQDKLDCIAQQHLCIIKVVCDSSNEEIAHSLEVVPYYQHDSNEARKHVDDAVEEFAQLYQKVSEPGIVKERLKIPLAINQGMRQQLIAELEEVGVFFLRSDDPCLIGPRACIEEAKQKVSDFISGRNSSSADNFGLAQASATDCVGSFTFKTPGCLTVHVSKGDLVHQRLDAIVNPANERLGNGGGAARAIAKAAGDAFQRECDEYIRKNGQLEIAQVMHTSAGNLQPKIKYVIHTVGPMKSEAKDDEELLALVRLAVFNCINYANEHLKVRSLAIPAISSGIYGVPIEIVGRASFEALTKFDEYCSASTKNNTVREIHFLNKDEPTFSNMKRIFQFLMTHESSVDPEQPVHATEALDRYADVFGRQRIETTPDDNCFTRAFATALQTDFQSELDWRKVDGVIRKELSNNKDYYKISRANEEPGKQWSWADVVKNPLDAVDAAFANIFAPMNGDKGVDPDLWISAAANALNIQIVLVQLSEKQAPVERNFKPRLTGCDKTVYIAYHHCGHHHFDALVKKVSSGKIVSGKKVSKSVEDAPDETKTKSSTSGHSHDINSGHSYANKNVDYFEKLEKNELKDMPPLKALGVAEKKAEKADGEKDDDNHCIICMDNITDKKELLCKHKFCRECIDEYFSRGQPKCPSCGKVFGTIRGDQPKGTMTWKESSRQRLAGYNDCGAIEIDYSFNDGRQGDNHPSPGQPYRGTHRTAFLPANKEGREVLRLLKRAFDARLVFTVGLCNVTGRDNVVIWNDIHHKTSPTGQYGYPDPTYLNRVKQELAAKGIL